MTARYELIAALYNEIDNADFSTEEKQDDSYRHAIAKITEIFKECRTIHDVVEVVNILDNLELSLKDAYENAVKFLTKE